MILFLFLKLENKNIAHKRCFEIAKDPWASRSEQSKKPNHVKARIAKN